jgi:hypothetical protein
VVRDLKNAATLLDQSIEAELQGSPTRDPGHVAFPMTARALMMRRDNLREPSRRCATSSPGIAGANGLSRRPSTGWDRFSRWLAPTCPVSSRLLLQPALLQGHELDRRSRPNGHG